MWWLSDLASVVTMQHSLCICCSSETKGSYANLPQLPKPYPFSTRNINTQLRPTAEKETEKLFCPLKKDYGQLPKRERKKNTTKNHKVTARDTAGRQRDIQTTAKRQSRTVMTCKAAAKRYRAHCLIIWVCLEERTAAVWSKLWVGECIKYFVWLTIKGEVKYETMWASRRYLLNLWALLLSAFHTWTYYGRQSSFNVRPSILLKTINLGEKSRFWRPQPHSSGRAQAIRSRASSAWQIEGRTETKGPYDTYKSSGMNLVCMWLLHLTGLLVTVWLIRRASHWSCHMDNRASGAASHLRWLDVRSSYVTGGGKKKKRDKTRELSISSYIQSFKFLEQKVLSYDEMWKTKTRQTAFSSPPQGESLTPNEADPMVGIYGWPLAFKVHIKPHQTGIEEFN